MVGLLMRLSFLWGQFVFSSAPFSAWGPALPADCFILASLQMCFREDINPNTFGDLGAYCGGSRLAGGFGGVLPHEVGWKLVHCLRCWCDSAKKKSSPLGFIFDTRAFTFCWWNWPFVFVPFCRDKCVFSGTHVFCSLGARWHKKKLNLFHHVLYMDDLPGAGPTFEDHPQVFGQKKSSPLDFIFDTCASASSNQFFFGGWWSWTYVPVPFCNANVYSALQIMNQPEFWIQWFEWNSSGPLLLFAFEPAFRLSKPLFLKVWAFISPFESPRLSHQTCF